MGHLAFISAAVLLGATACGTAAPVQSEPRLQWAVPMRSAVPLRSGVPLRNVLVYARPSSGKVAIYRALLDGSHAKRLALGMSPVVSPDGRWVAFDGMAHLFVIPTAGGAAEKVYNFTRFGRYGPLVVHPTWAPDSRSLAFDTVHGLTVVDLRSLRTRVVAATGSTDFSFSPDSRKIVYSVADSRGGTDLYVVPTSGGTIVRLTHDHKSSNPVWGRPGIAFRRAGRQIPGALGYSDIWLSDGRTDHIRRMTHTLVAGASPVAFSTDDKKLLASSGDSDGQLWAVDLTTGVERPIASYVGSIWPLGLSDDGRKVLACDANETDGKSVLVTIPLPGGKPHVIAHGACDLGASWNAR